MLTCIVLCFGACSKRMAPVTTPGPNSPITVTVNFVKNDDSPVKLERLDGTTVTMEHGSAAYVSTPIATDDAAIRGVCRLERIPPGKYEFNISRLKLRTPITIPTQNRGSAIIQITFGRALSIRVMSESEANKE